MKYAKFNSLRTQQAIALFGKDARYPLCLAALEVWRLDAELKARTRDVALSEEVLKDAKPQEEQMQALLKQLHKERKEKEANEAAALLRKIDEHLLKAQTCYQATVKLRAFYHEGCGVVAVQFRRECDAVIRSRDVKARRALKRLRRRWLANETLLQDRDYRTLEILKMLRSKVIKAVWEKDGPAAGYTEAAFGGDRPLSDEIWARRLTAREIAAEVGEVKESRRLAKKLGIILAVDQRGRKQKPYTPKPKRICPQCLIHELEKGKQLCRYCAVEPKILGGDALENIELITSHKKTTSATPLPASILWQEPEKVKGDENGETPLPPELDENGFYCPQAEAKAQEKPRAKRARYTLTEVRAHLRGQIEQWNKVAAKTDDFMPIIVAHRLLANQAGACLKLIKGLPDSSVKFSAAIQEAERQVAKYKASAPNSGVWEPGVAQTRLADQATVLLGLLRN